MMANADAERIAAAYLAHAPEQGDWPWEDHCEGVASGIFYALHDAGWRLVKISDEWTIEDEFPPEPT
jgi:hypothetical protein